VHHNDENPERPPNETAASSPVVGLEDLRIARQAIHDREAAHRLLERIAPRVRHMVQTLVGWDNETEDYTHTCLLAILENLGKYQGKGPLEAWAGQLTYRVLMRQLKRRRRSERTVTLPGEETGFAPGTPELDASQRQRARAWVGVLERLPEKRRETLVLRLVYGYSVAEVAEMTGTPVNTVRDRIRVGLKDVRRLIAADPRASELLGDGRFEDSDER
jgi:RNA polymerase sigma-70 factor, ECF subfamily